MAIWVEFQGGPADGLVQEYPAISQALPSLFWHGEDPVPGGAVYHRLGDSPDPVNGLWRYEFSSE